MAHLPGHGIVMVSVPAQILRARKINPPLGALYRQTLCQIAVTRALLSTPHMHLIVMSSTTGLLLERGILLPEHTTRELKQWREITKAKSFATTQIGTEAVGIRVIILSILHLPVRSPLRPHPPLFP